MYYNKPIEDVLREFETSYCGLKNDEAKNRLKKYGPNCLKEKEKIPLILFFIDQFKSPLVYILLIASVFTFAISRFVDGLVILIIVVLNSIIGFVQEYKAEKEMQSLKRLTSQTATVIRNDIENRINSSQLVPGDIVEISTGNRVPADLRLFEVKELEIDESAFTGESVPEQKHTDPIKKENLVLADQDNMAFMGTIVTNGRGKGITVKTGEQTELGKISSEVRITENESTPLQDRLIDFSKKIGLAAGLLSLFILIIGILKGIDILEIILMAISLTVAVIPEGLPVVVTITMAIGVSRMVKKNALIRRLIAAETLGSCNYICSDKTGTITENRMMVLKAYTNGKEYKFSGTGYNPNGDITLNGTKITSDEDLEKLLLTGLLCNTSDLYEEGGDWKVEGDPTEGALIVAAQKYGIDTNEIDYKYRIIDEISFSSKRQYMSMMYKDGDGYTIFVKGSPEKILDFTNNDHNAELNQIYSEMAESGLRVLGFGIKKYNKNTDIQNLDLENESTNDLEFVGFQGIMDPPRKNVKCAIECTKKAGIQIVMLTGDHKITATSIAREIGILKENEIVVTGEELDTKGEPFLKDNIEKISVYARVSPHHKLKIIEALQDKGNIVAVTGDGVNDAPALKKANIGVAMGKIGTDVAKEASDIILKDDNFATIFEAVKIGRVIYSNIQKVIFFLLSSNVGFALAIILSLFLNFPLPFLATQVLWVNLVANGLQDIALAYEPGEKEFYTSPPRNPNENIINKFMLKRIILIGITLGIGTLLIFWHTLNQGFSLTYARTAALNTVVFFQFFNVLNSRSFSKSIFQLSLFSNPFLFVSLILALIAQISVVYLQPLQFVFHTSTLLPDTFVLTVLTALSIIVVIELDKLYQKDLQEMQVEI